MAELKPDEGEGKQVEGKKNRKLIVLFSPTVVSE